MIAILETVENPSSVKSKLANEIHENLVIVSNLSKDMGVDPEFVKRYLCCMLYAIDYHAEAEKV